MNPLKLSGYWDSLYATQGLGFARFDCPGHNVFSFGCTHVKIFSDEKEYEKYHNPPELDDDW